MKKVLYLGLVMVLCFSMIGCSNSNAFKVGETEFSNEEVDKVKSILTATQSYTDADYLSEFKESKDNDDKVKDEGFFGDFFILLFFVLKLAAIQAHQPEDFPLAYNFIPLGQGKGEA